MPAIVEIHRRAAKAAGLDFEPERLQNAAADGRVPFVKALQGRDRLSGFGFDVVPGREGEFEACGCRPIFRRWPLSRYSVR